MYRYSSESLWSTLSKTNIHGEKLSKSRQKLISTHRVPLKWNILHVFVHSQSTAYALARHFIYVAIGMHGVFQTWTLSVSEEYSGLHPMRSRRICSMLTFSKQLLSRQFKIQEELSLLYKGYRFPRFLTKPTTKHSAIFFDIKHYNSYHYTWRTYWPKGR